MRMVVTILLAPLTALILGVVVPAQASETVTGSGVVIGTHGEILTNSHVVESCEQITVLLSSKESQLAVLVARDQKNDLAVVRINNPPASVAAFREAAPLRAGDAVVALGYPLSGLLATTANLTVGNVSALAGLGDDSRYLQISAPVQPGNSGGPLLDASGHLVGIVTSKLNATSIARVTGDIPQNVNFAIKAEVARTFLDSNGIAYRTARSDQQLSPADVGDMARPFAVYIECHQAATRSAAAPTPPRRPLPSGRNPTSPNPGVGNATSQQLACSGRDHPTTDQKIVACTDMIQSRQYSGKILSTAFNNRGVAYNAKGDLDHAFADYNAALLVDPKYALAFNNRGLVYAAKGDLDRAIADYDQAVKLDPINASEINVNIYNNRGVAYASRGNLDRAIADYNAALLLDPAFVNAFNNRGDSYRRKGNYDRAMADYNKALRLDPKNVAANRNRGFTYFYEADFPAAATDMKRWNELKEGAYPMLWRYLARARGGNVGGAEELAANAARLKAKEWPYPVIEFYLGKRSAAEMSAVAAKPEERCEAQFYLGEWYLLRGNGAGAAGALRTAADTCPKAFYEYEGAIAELKRLNQ
jgi:lipoprotein NlpI